MDPIQTYPVSQSKNGLDPNSSHESIHGIAKFKPFENGWVSEPISIGLKTSIHGFKSMDKGKKLIIEWTRYILIYEAIYMISVSNHLKSGIHQCIKGYVEKSPGLLIFSKWKLEFWLFELEITSFLEK